jgi:hypothetical protein
LEPYLGSLAELSDAHLLKQEIFGIYGVSLEGRCYNYGLHGDFLVIWKYFFAKLLK